jgi:hypothetical protein
MVDGWEYLNVHPHHLVPAILLYILPLAMLPD